MGLEGEVDMDKIKIGDVVNYHSTVGGPISSYGDSNKMVKEIRALKEHCRELEEFKRTLKIIDKGNNP
jgi:hypothetical protein